MNIPNLLKAAEENLEQYIAMGDENAIRAGQQIVDELKEFIERWK